MVNSGSGPDHSLERSSNNGAATDATLRTAVFPEKRTPTTFRSNSLNPADAGSISDHRNLQPGKFGGQPMGADKARKFCEVEGLALGPETAQFIESLNAQGLTGDALRKELKSWFAKRRQG